MYPKSRSPIVRVLLATLFLSCPTALADESVRYSDAVVEKAERILTEHGLKRVGGQIQPAGQTELAQLSSEDTRLHRALRQQRGEWQEAEKAVAMLSRQIDILEQQVGRWNAQYAAIGNPLGRNNELVARINAGSAQLKQVAKLRDANKEVVEDQRRKLRDVEEEYAELVLKMRRHVDAMRKTVTEAAQVDDVGIAFRVLATRYETPEVIDVEAMLSPLERRVRKLEESVFSESIPLEAEGGGLFVEAVVGLEPVRMLVDSGAALVLVPQELAEKLELKPEADARDMTMVTADGRRIAAKEIFLPRVRVGKFEAENVRAALLVESVAGAKPLLGMSFLEHFKFELDASQKTLTMLTVEPSEP